jgi:hypothetical protein
LPEQAIPFVPAVVIECLRRGESVPSVTPVAGPIFPTEEIMGGCAPKQLPATLVDFLEWIDGKIADLESLADHPIGESGEVHMPVAVDRTKEEPHIAVGRLFDPSPGYVCLSEFRTLVRKLCPVELATDLRRTFPEEGIRYVRDLLLTMRWLHGKLLPTADQDGSRPATKPKRGTQSGEGRAKLISALTKYHDYADGGCLNVIPIGSNKLARLAGVAESTASAFFKREFGGLPKYRARCSAAGSLADSLKVLNGEFTPDELTRRFSETVAAVRRENKDE